VTHGEPETADSLRQAVDEQLKWPASVPEDQQSVDLAAVEEERAAGSPRSAAKVADIA